MFSFMPKEEEAQVMGKAAGILLTPTGTYTGCPSSCLARDGCCCGRKLSGHPQQRKAGAACAAAVQAAQMRGASLPRSIPKPEPGCQRRGRQRLIDHSHFLAVHQAAVPESSERFCLDVKLRRKKTHPFILKDPLETMGKKSLE